MEKKQVVIDRAWARTSRSYLIGWFSHCKQATEIESFRLAADTKENRRVLGMADLSSCVLPSQLGLYNATTASLQRGKTAPNKYPGYDTKQSDGKVPAVLELWGMRSTPSLPSLPGPFWPGVVAPDRVLSMG